MKLAEIMYAWTPQRGSRLLRFKVRVSLGTHTRKSAKRSWTERRPPRHRRDPPRRFIPARAGNAATSRACRRMSAVHPRACGERRPCRVDSRCRCGSSPRVRGTRTRLRHLADGLGSSPRVRGTPFRPGLRRRDRDGSSPRVRGTHPVASRAQRPRFIPARAGNARRGCRRSWLEPVHPRACGEHHAGERGPCDRHGSSPRVRGTPATPML